MRLTPARTLGLLLWSALTGWVVLARGVPGDVGGVVVLGWLFTIAWNIEQPPRVHARFARDWAPLVLVLVAYTYTRGLADDLGVGPFVRWPAAADAWLGAGTTPTERLQDAWCADSCTVAGGTVLDAILSLTYLSHFVVAYVLATWWYVADRGAWRAWVRRFLALYGVGLVVYVVHPLAPPWWAARQGVLDSDVTRITGRGIDDLGLHLSRVLEGPVSNQVAAMPSLHAATAVLVSLVLADRATSQRGLWWHLYPVTMSLALVYFAEHYVVDLVAGTVLAVVVHRGLLRWERRET